MSNKSKTIIWQEITGWANKQVIYNLYEKDEKFPKFWLGISYRGENEQSDTLGLLNIHSRSWEVDMDDTCKR